MEILFKSCPHCNTGDVERTTDEYSVPLYQCLQCGWYDYIKLPPARRPVYFTPASLFGYRAPKRGVARSA